MCAQVAVYEQKCSRAVLKMLQWELEVCDFNLQLMQVGFLVGALCSASHQWKQVQCGR